MRATATNEKREIEKSTHLLNSAPLGVWLVELLGHWAVGPLGRWAVGPLGRWAVGRWAVGLLGCWVVGLLGYLGSWVYLPMDLRG